MMCGSSDTNPVTGASTNGAQQPSTNVVQPTGSPRWRKSQTGKALDPKRRMRQKHGWRIGTIIVITLMLGYLFWGE